MVKKVRKMPGVCLAGGRKAEIPSWFHRAMAKLEICLRDENWPAAKAAIDCAAVDAIAAREATRLPTDMILLGREQRRLETERRLQLPVAAIEAIPVRTANALAGMGVLTVRALVRCRAADILGTGNMGQMAVQIIRDELKKLGFYLAGEEPAVYGGALDGMDDDADE